MSRFLLMLCGGVGCRCARYCWGVAHGMEYLTSLNIVHRGLTANSVLVDGDDNPRIAGFGLTASLTPDLALDSAGKEYRESELHLRLPVRWCAPEVLEYNHFTAASDVWSFGIVCIEIFSKGARPFHLWADSKVVAQVVNGYTPTIPRDCPELFYNETVRPCFEYDAEDRPSFAGLSHSAQQSTGRAAVSGLAQRFRRRDSAGPAASWLPRPSPETMANIADLSKATPHSLTSSQGSLELPRRTFLEPDEAVNDMSLLDTAPSAVACAGENDASWGFASLASSSVLLSAKESTNEVRSSSDQVYEDDDAALLEFF